MTSVTPEIYQALALAAGLKIYAKSGMLPNRAWTPKAMRETAQRITGRTFKARDYLGMAEALRAWADEKAGKTKAPETVS